MTPERTRALLAEHLIRCARDDIPTDKIRTYLYAFDVPHEAHHDELNAIAELITNAHITVTWG